MHKAVAGYEICKRLFLVIGNIIALSKPKILCRNKMEGIDRTVIYN
jgi:hypothetical protein